MQDSEYRGPHMYIRGRRMTLPSCNTVTLLVNVSDEVYTRHWNFQTCNTCFIFCDAPVLGIWVLFSFFVRGPQKIAVVVHRPTVVAPFMGVSHHHVRASNVVFSNEGETTDGNSGCWLKPLFWLSSEFDMYFVRFVLRHGTDWIPNENSRVIDNRNVFCITQNRENKQKLKARKWNCRGYVCACVVKFQNACWVTIF